MTIPAGEALPYVGANLASGDDVYGQVIPGPEFVGSGRFTVTVKDLGGNTLAAGTVVVTP